MSELGLSLNKNYFPAQKVSDSKKKDKFFKECVEAGISLTWWNVNNYNNIRNSRREKIINYNLRRNIIEPTEMERIVNPFRIAEDRDFPATYKHYPILNQNLNVLIGEERKRLFNPIATIISEDFWNEKMQDIDARFSAFATKHLLSNNISQEQTQQELQEFNKWRMNYRDRRERMVQQIIEYGMRCGAPGGLPLKEEFSRGFEDLITSAEEIYVADILSGEPVLRKGNPLNFYTLRGGHSYKIEDSDIIIEDGYLSIGEVIDRYHEYLSDGDINTLETGHILSKGGVGASLLNPPSSIGEYIDMSSLQGTVDNVSLANRAGSFYYGGYYDAEGNVRVTRVVWRGFRKIGFVDYVDEFGETQTRIVPEQYEPNTKQGEKVKWEWITEWYEGTKIGYDLYVKTQPIPFQSRHRDNPSICHPGIVGTIYNVNVSKAQSLVDEGKNYQYLFNAFMYKLEMLNIKNKGKVAKLPLHLIPDGWSIDKALYYAETLGWLPIDSFNEGQQGSARGKLAGGMNESSPVIDLEMSGSIQNTFLMLDFIKKNLDDLTGVTSQRKGAIDNRETKGGVEMALTRSSVNTEKWFGVHDNTKTRAIKAYIEVCKIAWKNKKFKRPYILDDGSQAILDFDGESFAEYEYGIDVSSSSSDMDMMQTLKSLAQPFMQNGGSMAMIMEIWRSKDPATLQRKIETYENQVKEQTNQAQQQEFQLQQAQLQQQADIEKARMENENMNKQLDRENDIYLAQIKALGFSKETDSNQNDIPDVLEAGKLALENTKVAYENTFKNREMSLKEREVDSNEKVKAEELRLKNKEIESKERIEKLKARTALKNRVSGEGKTKK